VCPTPLAASVSASGFAGGGSEEGSGAEAGGGDACPEMRKVKRGCIVDDEGAQDESGSRVLGVSFPRLCYRSSASRNTKRRGGGRKTHTSSDSAQA